MNRVPETIKYWLTIPLGTAALWRTVVHSFLQLIPYITQGSYIRDLESCLFSTNVELCTLGAQCEEYTSALKY